MSLLDDYEQAITESSKPKSLLEEVEASMQGSSGPNAYETFLSNNRPHQNAALLAIGNAPKGQVIVPTGTGKTRIQIALLVKDMLDKTSQGLRGVYVIASHRLLLNKQLMDEYQDLCIKCGLPINVLYVGSARQDEKAVYDRYFNQGVNAGTYESTYTTSGKEVKAFYEKTVKANRHLIVVSTYHSFGSLYLLDAIDICTYDEAHNTTQESFQTDIKQMIPKIKRNYFFTATRKVCIIGGHGMENLDIYGDILCDIGPREMIEAGEIVRPRLITMMLDTDTPKGVVSNKNQYMLVKTIIEAFDRNKKAMKETSAEPSAIGTKLLVSFVGSDELALVQDSEEFQSWCQTNGVKVFSFSSRYGALSGSEGSENQEYWVESERNKVYEEMRNLKDEEDCVLLHIDILAEGIDLPSITGVLLLRHLNEIKLFQTLGRALRLMKVDRKRLYTGEFGPADRAKYVKPYAYLILPTHFEGMETSSEDMKQTIQDVISTYGIPVEEFLPPEDFKARDIKSLDTVTNIRKINKTKKDYPLLAVIEDFVMEEFKKSLPSDPQEKYDTLMNLLKKHGEENA